MKTFSIKIKLMGSILSLFSASSTLACDVLVHCWLKSPTAESHDNICVDEGMIDYTSRRVLKVGNAQATWQLIAARGAGAELNYPSVEVEVSDSKTHSLIVKALLHNSVEDWGRLELSGSLSFQCNIND